MNLRDAYRFGCELLEKAGIYEAQQDAWLLLEHVTGIDRAKYFTNPDERLTKEQEESYRGVLEEREQRIPLQHIVGEQEFMGLVFKVNEHVLIPRQDTEVLVETVLEQVLPGMEILDMCTGSGCIIISLLSIKKGLYGIGVDISEEALSIARENATAMNVDVDFLQSDIFEHVRGKYDIIVSNPPYIKTEEIAALEKEVRMHDPILALDGREDGLYFYRKIIGESSKYLKENGMLFFEIGYDQGESVSQLMKENGYQSVTIKKDLAGLDRVVFGVYNVSEDMNR